MMTLQKIATATQLPVDVIESHFREAISAGLSHQSALQFTAGLARGIIEERARGRNA